MGLTGTSQGGPGREWGRGMDTELHSLDGSSTLNLREKGQPWETPCLARPGT
jgi:hypothetical protein